MILMFFEYDRLSNTIYWSNDILNLLNKIQEYKDKQDYYKRQFPKAIDALKEIALIDSTISSNRLSGIDIEKQNLLLLREKNILQRLG